MSSACSLPALKHPSAADYPLLSSHVALGLSQPIAPTVSSWSLVLTLGVANAQP